MRFLKLWLDGLFRPNRMTGVLAGMPKPYYGLAAVLVRFVFTSFTSVLSLYLLGRLPFAQSELVRLPIEKYYLAEMLFLPAWGIAIWLLMGSLAHLLLRLFKTESDFDQVLNILGFGMLVPMPFVWIWDWTAIALNIYGVTIQAITHSIAQSWEAIIEGVCFVRILRIKPAAAIVLAVLINGIYIGLAMVFIR